MDDDHKSQVSDSVAEADADNPTPTQPNPWRWAWRMAALALFFYLLGYFSHPVTTPLMCKIYG
ncbi:MAG: hypothetical protein EKK46_14210 [Rhodocyclaceae bacterium]|nr:MAG: hypothetical protein EKK46_14210 [Rhodocyclaceae bacterium]